MVPQSRPAARRTAARRRWAAGVCLLAAAGCGTGRLATTYRPGDGPPPAASLAALRPIGVRPPLHARDELAAAGPAHARRDAAVRPAGFAPAGPGAGETARAAGWVTAGWVTAGWVTAGWVTAGSTRAKPPPTGRWRRGPATPPTAGPLQTEIGDAPTDGPLDPGADVEERTDLDPDTGDLGAAAETLDVDGGDAGLGAVGDDTEPDADPGEGTDAGAGPVRGGRFVRRDGDRRGGRSGGPGPADAGRGADALAGGT